MHCGESRRHAWYKTMDIYYNQWKKQEETNNYISIQIVQYYNITKWTYNNVYTIMDTMEERGDKKIDMCRQMIKYLSIFINNYEVNIMK